MKLLAWDQSSKKSGWCFLEDGKYVKSGIIDKSDIADIDTRIGEMGIAICQQIKEFNPDIVVIEDIQNQSSISTVISLARLQGFILGWCYVKHIKTEIIRPSEWRKVLKFKQGAGVKRQELKAQSMNYIKTKYNMELSEDEGEACCIADASWIKFVKH
jgi:Holliday junction resolvasome RuvABC endonuclease subunit